MDLFLLCFIYLYFLSNLVSFVNNIELLKTNNYPSIIESFKFKRNTVRDLYHPIRILSYYTDPTSYELNKSGQERLQYIVDVAISKITQFLSVIPISGPLFLSRLKACQTFWIDGPNVGRCGRIKNNYDGESCFNNIDNFKIPQVHLSELYVYSNSPLNHIKITLPKGEGALETDFILYVKSSFTFTCQSQKVIAYATFCQQNEHGRPIASYFNFCPAHLQDDLYDHHKAILTVIHELFHALGFSKDLFKDFEECSDSETCVKRSKIIHYDQVLQSFRLILPSVVREMQNHFNCSEKDFGAPLDIQNGEAGSHWHPRLLYGSIMAPSLGRPHQTAIDRITLAVLQDSGWYRVNFDAAEIYLWGQGEGCNFGLEQTCQKSEYFCQTKSSGCHFMHLDKARCIDEVFSPSCKIMKSDDNDICTRATPGKIFLKSGEIYDISSRCFLANISSDELTGYCFKHRCLLYNTLQIQLNKSEWIDCPFNTMIQIPGFDGIVQCPKTNLFCTSQKRLSPTTAETPVISRLLTPPFHFFLNRDEDEYTVHLTLAFLDVNWEKLTKQNEEEAFKAQVIQMICNITKITESRIINAKLKPDRTMNIEILSPETNSEGPSLSDAVSTLIDAVYAKEFFFFFGNTLISVSHASILENQSQLLHENWSEIQIVLIVLGLITLIILVLTIIIIFVRKKRQIETVQVGDLSRLEN